MSVLALIAPPMASADLSSGEITRAEANTDWSLGSIAGTATWSGCSVSQPIWEYPVNPWEPGYEYLEYPYESPGSSEACNWRPFVTVGPGSEASDCQSGDRWPWSTDGTEITLAWVGSQVTTGGTQTFDLDEVPLTGGTEQLVCLSATETVFNTCVPTENTVCPMWVSSTGLDVLDSTLLTGPPAPPEESEPEGSEETGGESEEEGEAEEPPEEPITESCPGPMVAGGGQPVCGTLNPSSNAAVGYYFAYNTGYSCTGGSQTPGAQVEGEAIEVSDTLEGLEPDTQYSYCLVATNAFGGTAGASLTFKTPAPPPPPEAPDPPPPATPQDDSTSAAAPVAPTQRSGAPTASDNDPSSGAGEPSSSTTTASAASTILWHRRLHRCKRHLQRRLHAPQSQRYRRRARHAWRRCMHPKRKAHRHRSHRR